MYKRTVEEWKEFEIEVEGRVRSAVSNHGGLKSFIANIKDGRVLRLISGGVYLS
jgi:hypothetical protein